MECEKSKEAQTKASEPREERLESTQMSLRCSSVQCHWQNDVVLQQRLNALWEKWILVLNCLISSVTFSLSLGNIVHFQTGLIWVVNWVETRKERQKKWKEKGKLSASVNHNINNTNNDDCLFSYPHLPQWQHSSYHDHACTRCYCAIYSHLKSLTCFNVESKVSLWRKTKAIREGLWGCAGCCSMGYKV